MKDLKYINSFSKTNEENILTPEAWVRPSRPFTDNELEKLGEMMEKD